jgi:hypothetical protein
MELSFGICKITWEPIILVTIPTYVEAASGKRDEPLVGFVYAALLIALLEMDINIYGLSS